MDRAERDAYRARREKLRRQGRIVNWVLVSCVLLTVVLGAAQISAAVRRMPPVEAVAGLELVIVSWAFLALSQRWFVMRSFDREAALLDAIHEMQDAFGELERLAGQQNTALKSASNIMDALHEAASRGLAVTFVPVPKDENEKQNPFSIH
jgi:hypothetical protein